MTSTLRQTFIIARRDFLAVAGTPTFLLFLLAPLFMILIGGLGGSGASQVAASSASAARIAVIAAPDEAAEMLKQETRMRRLVSGFGGPPTLEYVAPKASPRSTAEQVLQSKSTDYVAVMYGPLDRPDILHNPRATNSARFLSELAEQTLRARKGGLTDAELSTARLTATRTTESSVGGRQMTGYFAVFGIFFLTLLLAGQSVGMLAEEKSNKVIEIIAAAVPLEAVFLGKLIGMFGVSLLFVGFWGILGGIAALAVPGLSAAASLTPAVGLPMFLTLCGLYFTMSYMLLGAVFLGVGGQAGTIREIQMLSLPITIFQVAMFGLSSAAASAPGSPVARFAEWFPFSSPFAMAARGATDASLWPHLIALVWQSLWVALTIWLAARLFRVGVLKSGSWKTAFGLPSR